VQYPAGLCAKGSGCRGYPRAKEAQFIASGKAGPVSHRYTISRQSAKRMRRVCAGTPVTYEQTVREEDAASVCGYTDTL
jgi:hypothetical protein